MLKKNELGKLMVPINEIIIGERIRQENGDLDVLALSISIHGQIDPIIVHQVEEHKYELVDGYRRIQAQKMRGERSIEARLFDTLDEETRYTLELELCLRRKSLTYVEEARACKRYLLTRRAKATIGGIGRFTGMIKNKEVAMELGMSEAAFSVNLKIADALDKNPALEHIATKTELLRTITRGDFDIHRNEATTRRYAESFVVETPINLLTSFNNKMIDLLLIHPDCIDKELVELGAAKLRMGGALMIFTNMEFVHQWTPILEKLNLYQLTTPFMWHIKNDDTYIPIIWAGKSREMPLRMMPQHMSYARSKSAMSIKAKPYNLISTLVKNNTEVGGLVVSTHTYDIDTVRFCIENTRNIRAACPEKILRDRLIMNLEKGVS